MKKILFFLAFLIVVVPAYSNDTPELIPIVLPVVAKSKSNTVLRQFILKVAKKYNKLSLVELRVNWKNLSFGLRIKVPL